MTHRTHQDAAALRLDLTHRAARGEPATVRVTKHAGNADALLRLFARARRANSHSVHIHS